MSWPVKSFSRQMVDRWSLNISCSIRVFPIFPDMRMREDPFLAFNWLVQVRKTHLHRLIPLITSNKGQKCRSIRQL